MFGQKENERGFAILGNEGFRFFNRNGLQGLFPIAWMKNDPSSNSEFNSQTYRAAEAVIIADIFERTAYIRFAIE